MAGDSGLQFQCFSSLFLGDILTLKDRSSTIKTTSISVVGGPQVSRKFLAPTACLVPLVPGDGPQSSAFAIGLVKATFLRL